MLRELGKMLSLFLKTWVPRFGQNDASDILRTHAPGVSYI
jgi:hypothetical protein